MEEGLSSWANYQTTLKMEEGFFSIANYSDIRGGTYYIMYVMHDKTSLFENVWILDEAEAAVLVFYAVGMSHTGRITVKCCKISA